jgi:type II secretory pathway pseudopilin PulG
MRYNSYKNIFGDQSGALLITIIVSLGIIALLSTISIPAYQRFKPNIDLNGATSDLVADLRYAQQLTISEQIIYTVILEPLLNGYSITSYEPATSTIKSVSLPSTVFFEEINGFTDDTVRYNSYGAVSEAGDIKLSNYKNSSKSIIIKPSGYVQSLQ